MKINAFFLLTIVLFLLLALHIAFWLNHLEEHEEHQTGYTAYPGGDLVMIASLVVGLFLASISLLAYRQDHRTQLLLVSVAYLILSTHCILWLLGSLSETKTVFHTITHGFGIVFLAPAAALVLIALKKRGK